MFSSVYISHFTSPLLLPLLTLIVPPSPSSSSVPFIPSTAAGYWRPCQPSLGFYCLRKTGGIKGYRDMGEGGQEVSGESQ